MQYLIEFEIPMKHVKLIKMSMHDMFNKVLSLVGKYLPEAFPVRTTLNNAMFNPHWFQMLIENIGRGKTRECHPFEMV
jgi:hypothetical protein